MPNELPEMQRSGVVPDELREHEPVERVRSTGRLLAYGAVTTAIALAFLMQILDGVCPVP